MKFNQTSANNVNAVLKPYITRIVGAVFFITGLIIFSLISMRFEIVCQSTSNASHCSLTREILYVYPFKTSLGNLQTATLHRWKNNKGRYQYNIILRSALQTTALTLLPIQNKRYLQDVVTNINVFIASPQANSFHIGSLASPWLLLLSITFAIFGFILFTVFNTVTLFMDREKKTFLIKRKNCYRETKEEHSLDKVTRIELQKSNNSKGQNTYRLIFVMNDQASVPLTKNYDNLLGGKLKLAKQLNNFLEFTASESILELEKTHAKSKKIALIIFMIAICTCIAIYLLMLKH